MALSSQHSNETMVEEQLQRPEQPDLAFPYLTTDTSAGFTDEYRKETAEGLMPIQDGLTKSPSLARMPSGLQRVPTKFEQLQASDPEKAEAIKDVLLVTWKLNDPGNPHNWSKSYRWFLTTIVAAAVVSVAFASAVVAGCFNEVKEKFQIGDVVAALTVSLMVCGFGLGPSIWSPLSELYGRKIMWTAPFAVYVIFNIPCALAPNIGGLLACRFICGLFASGPLALAGSTIADIWANDERGLAVAIFAAAPYGGPVLGPIVGGFVGETVGFAWVIWVNMIFSGVVLILLVIFVPETYAPVLLKRRAIEMSKEHPHLKITTEQLLFKRPVSELIKESCLRPFVLIFTEPILVLFSGYAALIYGILYAFFFAYPVLFEQYHMSEGIGALMFIPVLMGVACALIITPFVEKRYVAQWRANGGHAEPEARLTAMLIGAPMIPIALFILAWTSPPTLSAHGGHWVGMASAGIPFGCGMTLCYFSVNAYLIDSYPTCVASSLAAKTLIRSGSGAAFPLFITAMLHNLTNHWGMSLLAFIALGMCAVPFVFVRFGAAIRKRSKLTV